MFLNNVEIEILNQKKFYNLSSLRTRSDVYNSYYEFCETVRKKHVFDDKIFYQRPVSTYKVILK